MPENFSDSRGIKRKRSVRERSYGVRGGRDREKEKGKERK